MVNVNQAVLGFLRSVASVVVFSAVLAVLSFLADATHLNGVVNDSLAALIAAIASAAEHSWESRNGTAVARRN